MEINLRRDHINNKLIWTASTLEGDLKVVSSDRDTAIDRLLSQLTRRHIRWYLGSDDWRSV